MNTGYITELLVGFAKTLPHFDERDEKYCEVQIFDGKIYFPRFQSHTFDTSLKDLVLESYGSFAYNTFYPFKVEPILEENGVKMPVAQQGDDIYCKCGHKHFTFSYGNYELTVKCVKCGNEWTAYDG
jgi:hypothetical protein